MILYPYFKKVTPMLLSGGNRLERALLALTATQEQTGYLPVPFRSTTTR